MNDALRSPNLASAAGAAAAAVLILSLLLPCESASYASVSYVDFATGLSGMLSGLEWLLLGLLFVGSGLALVGLGLRALSPGMRSTATWLAFAGFCAGLAGELIWVLDFSGHSGDAQRLGASIGPAVWIGATAAAVGLIVTLRQTVGSPTPAAPRFVASNQMFEKPEQAHVGQPGLVPPVLPTPPSPDLSAQPASLQWAPLTAPPAPSAPVHFAAAPGNDPVPSSAAAPEADDMPTRVIADSARLTYVEDGRPTSVVVTQGRSLLIGRDASAEIHLSDPRVSRRHARIERRDGKWTVTDLMATNPTRLLDEQGAFQVIYGQVSIASGQLLIGDVVVTLFAN
jgi:hypothetical protein